MAESEVRSMQAGVPAEVSLEAVIGNEGDLKLEDLIEDESIVPVDDALIRQSRINRMVFWNSSM